MDLRNSIKPFSLHLYIEGIPEEAQTIKPITWLCFYVFESTQKSPIWPNSALI